MKTPSPSTIWRRKHPNPKQFRRGVRHEIEKSLLDIERRYAIERGDLLETFGRTDQYAHISVARE